MKSTLLFAAVLALGLMFFFYRRRLRLAVLVCGSLYLAITAVRLFVLREDVDRVSVLVLAVGGLAAVWLLTNMLTGLVVRRRHRAEP